ncbi:hypothetical protein KI387_022414, partial [Taxus chinensis]
CLEDVISRSAMIAGYAQSGLVEKAHELSPYAALPTCSIAFATCTFCQKNLINMY